jgi:hypothetical protein
VAQGPGTDDRLPWLESPRPSARARTARAARRARVPLLTLLALFCAAAVALLSFLAGRASGPRVRSKAPPPAVVVAQLPPARIPSAPVVAEAPAPLPATSTVSPKASAPTKARPRATVQRAKAKRRAPVRKPRRSLIPDIVIHRNAVPPRAPSVAVAPAPQRRIVWPAQPFAGAPGKVIQLGSFRTMAQADAAWWRLVRAYPYLGTLPRVVTYVGPTPGRVRIYQLKLAAGSRREARILCRNLHRVGRGCAVLKTAN